jgi:hypothetical protein
MSTIVSAFVSNVNHKFEDSLKRYYNFGKLLLKSTTPKIIFVDDKMFELIGTDYDKTNTVIIKIIKNNTYLYEYIIYITNFRLHSTDHTKDTIEFMFTMCNKTEWMRQAIELNPFKTDNFIWLDFGIKHVFNCSDDQFVEKINLLHSKKYEKIRIGGIWNINTMYNCNIYKDVLWYFAGGVFGGDKESLLKFADLTKAKCIEIMTTKNTIMWEVNIWYIIYNENKHLFDIYKCNHDNSIIENY